MGGLEPGDDDSDDDEGLDDDDEEDEALEEQDDDDDESDHNFWGKKGERMESVRMRNEPTDTKETNLNL